MARVVTDLLEPDSPTMANVSPFLNQNQHLEWLELSQRNVSKEMFKSFTSNNVSISSLPILPFSDQRHLLNRPQEG